MRRACEDSLRRLQTDHIDLYQMHHVDRGTRPGTRSGRRWSSSCAGQGHLRRQQQLRRLAHRPGQRERGAAALPGPGHRAEHLQPGPRRRAGGPPGLPGVRARRDPGARSPAACWPARWQAPSEGRRCSDTCGSAIEKHQPQLERYEAFCNESARAPATWRWPGCCTTRRHRADHRAAHHGATRRRLRALEIKLDEPTCASSTKSARPGRRSARGLRLVRRDKRQGVRGLRG